MAANYFLLLICYICFQYVDASSSVDFLNETLKITNDGYNYKGWRDLFGYDMAVNEDLLVVSAPGDQGEIYIGSVTVFRRKNGAVQQPGKKLFGMRRDFVYFGITVAVNDDFIVVGSKKGYGTSIYRSYEPCELVAKIEGNTRSVLINDENTIFIGDPYSDDYHGVVRIYSFDKLSHNWTLSQTLKPPVVRWLSGDFYIYVDSSSQYLVVTSRFRKIMFLYRKNTGGVWKVDQNLTHSIPFSTVIIESERLFIGSRRESKVYVYNLLLNSTWSLSQTIQPPDVDGFRVEYFGSDISVQDDVLVIGAPGTTFKDAEPGACFLYVLNHETSNWIVRAVLMASNGTKNTKYLGSRLLLYDNKVFVQSKDIARSNSGSVHEYDVSKYVSKPKNNFLAWYVILIIVLISLLIVVTPLLLVMRCAKGTNYTVAVQ